MDLLINVVLWSIMNDSHLLSYIYTQKEVTRQGEEEGFSITIISSLKKIHRYTQIVGI